MKTGLERVGLVAGLLAPIRGLGFVFHPDVRRAMGVAIAVYGVAFIVLVDGLMLASFWLTEGWVDGGAFSAVAGWSVRVVAIVVTGLVAPFVYIVLGALMMPKLKSRVFRSARTAAGGPEAPLGISLKREVHIEIVRLLRFLLFTVLLLPLLFFGDVGAIVYVALGFTLAAHTLGWDLLAYHFEYHGLSYGQQKALLRANRPLVLALGGVAAALLLIPMARAIFVSSNVAGAGALSARIDRRAEERPG